METRNLKYYDPQEEDWNEFINHFHDPDTLYYYIKQIYNTKNVKEILTEVPEAKKDAVGSIYKLEVFRATMQYVEEFIMYFLAYIEGYKNIGEKLVKTSTTTEVKEFLGCLTEKKQDEFSQKKKSINFKDLLKELFGYNSFLNSKEYKKSKEQFDEIISESIKIIENDLFRIASYYLEHLKIYNAIKHGTRVFPLIQNEIKIGDESISDAPKDTIIVICKDESAKPYRLTLPPEYIIDRSFKIADKTHLFFKCIRNVIRDKLIKPDEITTQFFKTSSGDKPEKKYIRGIRGKNIFIIETPENFEVNDKPLRGLNACKIILKGKNIFFHTKFDKEASLEYPFLIKSQANFTSDLEPTLVDNIHFNFDLYDLHIGQYFDLLKITQLKEKDKIKNVIFVSDLNNKEFSRGNAKNFNFPKIPEDFDMKYLHFLLKIEKATEELIPFPVFTSKIQEEIIEENIDRNLSKKDAEEILSNLKSQDSKIVCTIISTKILDFNGNEISSRTFEPVPREIIRINFENLEDEKEFKEEIFETPGKFIKTIKRIDEIPSNIIEKIDLVVKNHIEKLPEIKEVTLPLYELITTISYAEPKFWYKEHFVTMVFKPIIYPIYQSS